MDTLLQDGVPNPANQDDICKDSLRMRKTNFKTDLQARTPQSNTESPMTITVRRPSQDQVMLKKKSGRARPGTTQRSKVVRKKQPQEGYNLGQGGYGVQDEA